MRVLLLATHNRHKVKELREMIGADQVLSSLFDVLSFEDIGYHEDIIEDGDSFEENALIKAKIGAALGYITVADDSGLSVDALHGAPGVYTARYAGENATDEENRACLLRALKDVAWEERGAKFISAIACVFPDGQQFTVFGECPGAILFEERGERGFGYDSLFYHEGIGKSFAEATDSEKNAISHRGVAMEQFCKALHHYI